jgi:hypothetical protein
MTNTKKTNKIPSFEEILSLFTDLDADEKMTFFNARFKVYLSNKTVEEKKLVGKIFLLLTRDFAEQLLKSLEQRRDINALEEMQKMLMSFSQRTTPSV